VILPENPISSYIFAVKKLSQEVDCKDGGGGRHKYKIFFVGGKEKRCGDSFI
jgi:hypothetical protein